MSPAAAEARALGLIPVIYGPWLGSMRSVPPDLVPPEYIADTDQAGVTIGAEVALTPSHDYHYLPRTGTWKRRLGQTQKFDTFGSSIGLLPKLWGAKARDLQEFPGSASLTSDGYPSLIALCTKEVWAAASLSDDGRFSNVYVRDQVSSANYTLGSDYSPTTTYPAATTQAYRVVPLWYDSGDGGITRGAAGSTAASPAAIQEFSQRFFASGSRRMQRVGRQWYFPNYRGTPMRWTGEKANAAVNPSMSAAAIVSDAGASWSFSSVSYLASLGDTDTADYATWNGTATGSVGMDFDNTTSVGAITASTTVKLVVSILAGAGTATRMTFDMFPTAGGTSYMTGGSAGSIPFWGGPSNSGHGAGWQGDITTSFVEYTYTLNGAQVANIVAGGNVGWRVLMLNSGTTGSFQVAYVKLYVGDTVTSASRVIPSGPWPMTHAGTLTTGTNLTATATYHPDADINDGSPAWVDQVGGTSLFAAIDETTADDSDYIRSVAGSGSTAIISIAPFASVPVAGDTVRVNYRSSRHVIGDGVDLNVSLDAAGTIVVTNEQTQSSGFAVYGFTLTDANIATVTGLDATWADIRIRLEAASPDAFEFVSVSHVEVTHRPAGPSTGGWRGADRFYYGVVPIFEDGSYFMPTLGRAPNSLLANGFNLFTVDSGNPDDTFDKITWSHLPALPYGFPYLGLVRSDKIDSSSEDDLKLNPLSLRLLDIVPAGTTTYVDYKADDDALQLDPDNLLVRWDHIMPPRARYAFAGDMRMCHAYGAFNPAAIIIAPVGVSADYDLNDSSGVALTDASAALYASAMHMRIDLNITTTDVYSLVLVKGNEASPITFPLTAGGSYDTLQKLVDGINATSFAVNAHQWRAQVCPGVPPDTPSTYLLPHARAIASCVVNATPNGTITVPSGTQVAVGALISGTGVTLGAYVSNIVSTTTSSHVITFTGAITTGTKTLTFYFDLGDNSQSNLDDEGYQRVIGNALPGFLYFRKTFLDQFPVEKSSVWMTTASPGSTKSAPNCFSGKLSNKFFPPSEAGIAMGGVAIDNGFFVPFSKRRAVIRNDRDAGTGNDEDYRLFITNENSGCVSFMSVCGGTGFGVCASPEGIIASSLTDEMLLSEAIWRPDRSEGNLSSSAAGVGDFSYEIPTSIAATAADVETYGSPVAYLACEIMRGILWVGYRNAVAAIAHPNRQVCYDFSSGLEVRGIAALKRSANQAWGWSVPLVRSVTALSEGRRSDGTHLYGWNEANAGSTGDGRIDEIETAETDNGTAIAGAGNVPWLRFGDDNISVQEVIVEHSTPAAAVATFEFHRSLQDDPYSLTATTSSQAYYRDRKGLTLPARAPSAAVYFKFLQASGSAQEIRKITLLCRRLRAYKLNV